MVYEGDDAYLSTSVCPVNDLCLDSKEIAFGVDGFQSAVAEDARPSQTFTSLPLKLVQANCCTFRTKNKRSGYLEQFHAAKIHMIGSQEARRQFTGVVVQNCYILAQSVCNKDGSSGVLFLRFRYFGKSISAKTIFGWFFICINP